MFDKSLILNKIRTHLNLKSDTDFAKYLGIIGKEMKDGTKNIIAACILAFGLILSTFIYAYSNRY